MKRQHPLRCLMLVVCTLVAGCIGTESKHPLSKVETAFADPGVIGTWVASKGKDKLTIKLESAGDQFPKNVLRLSLVLAHKQDVAGYCYITKMAGKGKYANVHCMNLVSFKDGGILKKWAAEDITGYAAIAYRKVDGGIHLFDPDEKFLLSAIEQGAIKGSFDDIDDLLAKELGFDLEDDPDAVVEGVKLTEPTDSLNKFFQANLGKIFPKASIKMTRVKQTAEEQ